MLAFLRKIRRSLIESGSGSKYILYAIGEISLVVIGILIALQVNNWNEEKKTHQLEKEILLELKDALRSDWYSFNVVIHIHEGILKSQDILIDWIEKENSYHDSLSYHFASVNRWTNDLLNTAPYETLKETGIRIIRNDSLRLMIQNLYDFQYEWYQKNTSQYKDYIEHNAHFINPKYFRKHESIDLKDDIGNTSMKPINIEKLKTGNEYIYHLYHNRDLNRYLLEVNMKPTKQKIQNLMKKIDRELDE